MDSCGLVVDCSAVDHAGFVVDCSIVDSSCVEVNCSVVVTSDSVVGCSVVDIAACSNREIFSCSILTEQRSPLR